MGALEGLGERYADFADGLEERGVPQPRVLVPVLALILLLGGGFLLFQSLAPQTSNLSFTVKDANGVAVPGVQVDLQADGKGTGSHVTGDAGDVLFSKVPKSAKLSVKITDPKNVYDPLTQDVSFTTNEVRLTLAPAVSTQETVTVLVSDANANPVTGASVTLTLDDGTQKAQVTDLGGLASFTLDAMPDHLTSSAQAPGFLPKSANFLKAELAANGNTFRLTLQSDASAKDNATSGQDGSAAPTTAFVTVHASGPDGSPVDGAQVKLKDAYSYKYFGGSAKTDETGSALFADIDIGRHFFVDVLPPSGFEPFTSDEQVLSSASGLRVEADLAKRLTGNFVKLKIVDGNGAAVSGAQVTLYTPSGKPLPPVSSGSDGRAVIPVSSRGTYFATAYADGFLPARASFPAGADEHTLTLKPVTDSNTLGIPVTVSNADGAAIGAQVTLYTSDGFPLGLPTLSTDAEGQAVFTVPADADSIYAKASMGTQSGQSSQVPVSDGATLEVTLEEAAATLQVSLQDADSGLPLENGSATAVSGGRTLAECHTQNCTLTVPPNTDFKVVATSEGYLQTESAAQTLAPAETRQIALQLVPEALAKSVSVKFLGLFSAQGLAKEAGNGERYLAKFLVSMPAGSTNAGFHAHLSGDAAEFEPYDSGAPVLYTSSAYDAASCYSGSSANQNDSFASQDLVFPKGFTGSKELDLKIHVKPLATASSSFRINYKAYAEKSDLVLSDPAPDATGGQTAPADALSFVQQECTQGDHAAETKVTSAPLLCNSDGSFCARLLLSSGAQSSRNGLEVAKGSTFTLSFDVLSSAGVERIGITAPNADFLGSTGTQFASATAAPSDASASSGTSASTEQRVTLNIPADQKGSGALQLRARKATLSSTLTATFYTGQDSKPYPFSLKITGSNPLRVSAAPLQLTAGEAKSVRVSVLDEQNAGLEDATATLTDCDGTPLNAQEPSLTGDGSANNGERGTYRFDVTPSNIGKIGVRVEQPDFSSYEACLINVAPADDSLSLSPTFLEFKGDSSNLDSKQLTATSTLGAKSTLTLYSNCFTSDRAPLLILSPPSISGFKDSATFDVSVLPNATAKTVCQVYATQKLTNTYAVQTQASIRVNVQSPDLQKIQNTTPSVPPTPSPAYPAIPSVVFLTVDENGYADAYYALNNLGQATACSLTGDTNFSNGVKVECVDNVAHYSADFSQNPYLDLGFTAVGRTKFTFEGQPSRSITVKAIKAATPVITGPCTTQACHNGAQLKCCDANQDGTLVTGECSGGSADGAYQYLVAHTLSSLNVACGLPDPQCALSVDQSSLTGPGTVTATVSYFDLPTAPNTLTVDCGNGKAANAVNCQGTTGSCTAKCQYDDSGSPVTSRTLNAMAGSTACAPAQVDISVDPSIRKTCSTDGDCIRQPLSTCTCNAEYINKNYAYVAACTAPLQTACPALPDSHPGCVNSQCAQVPGPAPEPETNNPALKGDITLYLDENGFAQAAYYYPQGDLTSCDIASGNDLKQNLTLDCNSRTLLITADYSNYKNLDKTFRSKGTLAVVSTAGRKLFNILVSGSKIPPKSCAQDPSQDACLQAQYAKFPSLPDRLYLEVDPYNTHFDYLFNLYTLGQPVSSCSLSGLDPSISSWIQLQYCGATDQRLRVLADFTGQSAYQQILTSTYRNNPYCQSLLNPQMGAYGMGAGYGAGYGTGINGYGGFGASGYGGLGCTGQFGAGCSGNTMFPNGNLVGGAYAGAGGSLYYGQNSGFYPSEIPYYSNNQMSGYPSGQLYDRYNNYPLQYSYYYRDSTANGMLGLGFGNGLPSSCAPTPLQGYITINLQDGSTRRVQLIVSARGTLPLQSMYQQPSQPLLSQDRNNILSPISVYLDPYTGSRFFQKTVSVDSSYPPLCKPMTDARFYDQVDQLANNPNAYGSQYYRQGSLQQPSRSSETTTRSSDPTATVDLSSAFTSGPDDCKTADGKVTYSFAVKYPGTLKASNDAALNNKKDAYYDLRNPATGTDTLQPIVLKRGTEDYKLEPVKGPIAFMLTSQALNVPDDAGTFKITDDVIRGTDGCSITGMQNAKLPPEAAEVAVKDIDGSLSWLQYAYDFRALGKNYVLDKDGKKLVAAASDTKETTYGLVNPADLGSPKLDCKTVLGGRTAELKFVSLPNDYPVKLNDNKASGVVPALGAFPAKLDSGKRYSCVITGFSALPAGDLAALSAPYDKLIKRGTNYVEPSDDIDKAFGCQIDSNGNLAYVLDYSKLDLEPKALAELLKKDHEVHVSVSVLTSMKGSSSSVIARPLGQLSLKVIGTDTKTETPTAPKPREPGTGTGGAPAPEKPPAAPAALPSNAVLESVQATFYSANNVLDVTLGIKPDAYDSLSKDASAQYFAWINIHEISYVVENKVPAVAFDAQNKKIRFQVSAANDPDLARIKAELGTFGVRVVQAKAFYGEKRNSDWVAGMITVDKGASPGMASRTSAAPGPSNGIPGTGVCSTYLAAPAQEIPVVDGQYCLKTGQSLVTKGGIQITLKSTNPTFSSGLPPKSMLGFYEKDASAAWKEADSKSVAAKSNRLQYGGLLTVKIGKLVYGIENEQNTNARLVTIDTSSQPTGCLPLSSVVNQRSAYTELATCLFDDAHVLGSYEYVASFSFTGFTLGETLKLKLVNEHTFSHDAVLQSFECTVKKLSNQCVGTGFSPSTLTLPFYYMGKSANNKPLLTPLNPGA